MKVRKSISVVTGTLARLLVVIPLSMTLTLGATVSPAHASTITRPQVIARAKHWIAKRIPYSQTGYHQGYRRDCSGFVSMAWKLKRSYTSSSIRSKAHRISWRNLKPGDAVRRTGHVEIFGGWKNKHRRQYWALEESTWGKPALRRVKTFKRGYSALRRHGIKDALKPRPRVIRVTRPVLPKPPVVVPKPSVPTTSVVPTVVPSFDSTSQIATPNVVATLTGSLL